MKSVLFLRYGKYNRRRTLLGLNGFIWALYGLAIATSPEPGRQQFGRLVAPLDWLLYSRWSAVLWAGCGLLAIGAALSPRRFGGEAAGFNALLVPALSWVALSVWSWASWLITAGLLGASRAWVSAVVWSITVLFILVTAGWPEETAPNEEGD